ncbi:hypothetical protein KKA95_05080 [Patescibacteria group bacterium]|nr:hypothetical protein [Patescibacteria group bacterium]
MEDLLIQITGSIVNAIQSKYDTFVQLAPFILGSIAIFLFGWILAELASKAILKMSEKLKLEWISDKVGLKHFLDRTGAKMSPSHVIAKSIKGYLIFVFFIEATKVARLTQIAEFLSTVLSYVPDVLISIFIMLVGIRIGNTMQLVISTSLSFAKSNTANVLGIAAKGTIIAFAILAALSELEIADILVQTLFIGFVSMLTLAGGLAFGLGGKDVVKELLEAIKRVEIKEHKKK